MEPTEFDKLLKTKLQEFGTLHHNEMDKARPFVWSAVQRNIRGSGSLRWYHLAAAIILLLISFVFVLRNVNKSHESEMVLLSQKIDELQEQYISQQTTLHSKDKKLGTLMVELQNVEQKLINLHDSKPEEFTERIVYRTDTVIVRQIEYVTREVDPLIAKEINHKPDLINEKADVKIDNNNKINYAIYPSVARHDKNQKSETIKVKFLKASRN